jgi:hypothetical protein
MTCRSVLTYKPPADIEYWVRQLIGEVVEYDHNHPLVDWVRNRLMQSDIKVIPQPRAVTVRKFEINWKDGKGTFTVALNGVELDQRFSCTIEGDGWLHCWHPHLQAPIGLHPDYPCYIFTDATELAIASAVRKVFPRLKPWGIDRSSGSILNALSSLDQRGLSSSTHVEARIKIALASFAVTEKIGLGGLKKT